MDERVILIIGLAVGTFSIRLAGFVLGANLPTTGTWARAFSALPSCLIASLVSVILIGASMSEWGAAAFAAICAIVTRSVPISMVCGIFGVWLFRNFIGLG